MKRTTIEIPEELEVRLRHEAKRRDSSVSEVVVAALESHLGASPRRLIATGAGSSGYRDTASRIEDILRLAHRPR